MNPLLKLLVIYGLLNPLSSLAQTSKWKELAIDRSPYQSRGIDVQLFKETYAGLEGQQYTIKISCLIAKKVKVAGTLFAVTYCGNKLSIDFSSTISPGKTLGGKDYLFDNDGMTGTVNGTDCKTEKIYPNPNDRTAYKYDIIRSVGLSGLTITPIDDDPPPSTSNISHSTATSAAAHPQTGDYTYTPPSTTRRQAQSTYTPPASTGNTVAQAVSNGLTSLSNSLTEMYAERQRQRDEQTARDNQATAERKEREQAEQEEKDRQREEKEREDREEMAERRREHNNGMAELIAENNLDQHVAGSYYTSYVFKKPRDVENQYPNLKTIYYVAFCRMDNAITLMAPLAVAKYSDDSWIPAENLMNKINPLFGTTTKVFTGDVYSNRLTVLGYFTNAADANRAYTTIRQNAASAGYSVKIVSLGGTASSSTTTAPATSKNTTQPSKDFWNN